VVSACESIGDNWVRNLGDQGIAAISIAPSALGTIDLPKFDICLIHEPTAGTLGLIRLAAEIPEVGILVVAACSDPEARAQWLDAGADDCVSLPANAIELGARIRAMLRRMCKRSSSRGVVTVGRLEVHLLQRDAYLSGKLLELTSNEFDLLASLARCAGRVLSRERLLELTKGAPDEAFDRSIDVQVSRLRAKLGDDPRDPQLLKTVRGRGYLLTDA
jgi:two-component system, OmpR family, response regulator